MPTGRRKPKRPQGAEGRKRCAITASGLAETGGLGPTDPGMKRKVSPVGRVIGTSGRQLGGNIAPRPRQQVPVRFFGNA